MPETSENEQATPPAPPATRVVPQGHGAMCAQLPDGPRHLVGRPGPNATVVLEMGAGVALIMQGEALHPTHAEAEAYPSPSLEVRLRHVADTLNAWLAPQKS